MTIAVDFDGTIVENHYPKIGPLFPGVKEALRDLRDSGFQIVLYTVRANPIWYDREKMIEVSEFIKANELAIDYIWTGQGKPMAQFYIDDRAVPFRGNWAQVIAQIKLNHPQLRKASKTVQVFVSRAPHSHDILKAIDYLGQLGGYDIQLRKAIDRTEFEHWFLEHIFENNRQYFDKWKNRLFADMEKFVGSKKLFPMDDAALASLEKFLLPYRMALVHNVTGWEVDSKMLDYLKANGLIEPGVIKYPELSYKLGMLHHHIQQEQHKWPDRDKFFKYLAQKAKEIELSMTDKFAIAASMRQANGYLSPTIENVIQGGLKSLYAEEDEVLRMMGYALSERQHPFLSGRLIRNELTKQGYSRDFERVARTQTVEFFNRGAWGEMTNKMQEFGIDTKDAEVYRIPSPASCEHCKNLALHSDGTPKRYKYATIAANGDNRGLKPDNWKPVIGSVHPNCRCSPWYRVIPGVTDLTYNKIFSHKVVG